MVAPLSLFQPELFKVTGSHSVHVQKRYLGDPEDPHDESYLRETSVSIGKRKFFQNVVSILLSLFTKMILITAKRYQRKFGTNIRITRRGSSACYNRG